MALVLPVLLLGSVAVVPPICNKTLPPAPVVVAGYSTSLAGCIGAQGRGIAESVNCGPAGKNLTAAAECAAKLCDATPGCAAFSVISPAYPGATKSLLTELHPDTIAQSSQVNSWWNVWQKSGPLKPGKWDPAKKPPSPPPPPPPSPEESLSWTTPSNNVQGSMPLGNGRLGVNVWADSTDTVWLLLSHTDALDENTHLDKLGRVAVRALLTTDGSATPSPQPFRQEMYLQNATVHIDLPSRVSFDIWVDATTDAVRVASSSAAPHKLEATLEIWRNTSGNYPGGAGGCSSLHPTTTLHADTVVPREDSILFYHRNLAQWTTPGWEIDLKSQQMPTDLPNQMTNITFGGLLAGGAGSKMAKGATPMQLVSVDRAQAQSLSIGGVAGRYDGEAAKDGLEVFVGELTAATTKPASREAHSAVWEKFWSSSDLTVTAAVKPDNPSIAVQADRVTLLDKVNRAAFHSMAMGKISAIKFNAYGIFSAYPSPKEDFRIWGACQWFQNIRLPYYHMLADGRFEAMKSLFGFYRRIFGVSKARTQAWYNITGTFFPETKQQVHSSSRPTKVDSTQSSLAANDAV